jgi:hypothetical protein
MGCEDMSDPIMRARVERILRGEVRVEDLTRLFLFARDRCDGRESVQEIGDFVAHHDERTKGIVSKTVQDWSVIVRFRGWMPNQVLNLQRLPAIFPDYLRATSRRLDHKTIKMSTGLKRSELITELPSLISSLIKNQDGSYAVNHNTTSKERSIIECLIGNTVVSAAFTGTRLFDDFLATLKSNELVRTEEIGQFSTLRHYVILFAAIQMHRCTVVIDGSFSLPLSVSGHKNSVIQVDCAVPMFFAIPNTPILNLSCAIFSTDLESNEYCEDHLLEIAAPWTFPLELSLFGRITQFQ